MKNNKKCKGYCNIACIDGSCPMALQEEYAQQYEDMGIDFVKSCRECRYSRFYNNNCDSCIFEGSEYCIEKGGKENGKK